MRRIEAANALASAAAFNAADAQVQLTTEVAQAYTNLRDRQQRAAALRGALDLQQRQLDLSVERFERGTVPAFTVGQANRALQATTSDLATAEAGVEVYLNALAVLTGEAPGALDALLTPRAMSRCRRNASSSAIPPRFFAAGRTSGRPSATLLPRRPALGSRKRLDFRRSLHGNPRIGGTSIGDLVDLGNVSKIAVPQLQWGLLDFGRTSAAIAQTRAGRDEAEAQYRQVVLGALQDAETSLSRFAQQRRIVAALAEIKRSAEQSAVLMRQRYERGVISPGDSLEAERQRQLAEANLRSEVAALTGSYVAIQNSLGFGWSEAGEPAPVPPAERDRARVR